MTHNYDVIVVKLINWIEFIKRPLNTSPLYNMQVRYTTFTQFTHTSFGPRTRT